MQVKRRMGKNVKKWIKSVCGKSESKVLRNRYETEDTINGTQNHPSPTRICSIVQKDIRIECKRKKDWCVRFLLFFFFLFYLISPNWYFSAFATHLEGLWLLFFLFLVCRRDLIWLHRAPNSVSSPCRSSFLPFLSCSLFLYYVNVVGWIKSWHKKTFISNWSDGWVNCATKTFVE